MKGENKAPALVAINPKGSLPFITYDGTPLYESAAILRFLATTFPQGERFYPNNNITRAKIDAAMDWNGTTFRKAHVLGMAPIFFARFRGGEPDAATVATCAKETAKLPALYAGLEADFKASGFKFLAGNEISIADFQCFCEATDINYKGEEASLDGYPLVKAWYERCG